MPRKPLDNEIGHVRLEPLINAFKDSDSWTVSTAMFALAKLGDNRAVMPLINLLINRNENSWASASALGELGDHRAVLPLMQALEDSDENLREAAASALGKLGDKRAVAPLINTISDLQDSVGMAAIEALGKLGDKIAIEPLINVLGLYGDGNKRLRLKAADALEALGEPKWGQAIRRDDDDYLMGLAETGDPRAFGPLKKALECNWSFDYQVKAIQALVKLGDKRAVNPIVNVLESDKESYCLKEKEESVKALGVFGDKRAVEPLIKALQHKKSRMIRMSAAEALGMLEDKRAVEPLI